nr:hypothetical protein [Actinosynnema mirum]
MPTSAIRLWPSRSARRPPGRNVAAVASRDAFTAHWTPSRVRSRPDWMAGADRATIVWSMVVVDTAMIRPTRAQAPALGCAADPASPAEPLSSADPASPAGAGAHCGAGAGCGAGADRGAVVGCGAEVGDCGAPAGDGIPGSSFDMSTVTCRTWSMVAGHEPEARDARTARPQAGLVEPEERIGFLAERYASGKAREERYADIERELEGNENDLALYGRLALEWGRRFNTMQREWVEWAIGEVGPGRT